MGVFQTENNVIIFSNRIFSVTTKKGHSYECPFKAVYPADKAVVYTISESFTSFS